MKTYLGNREDVVQFAIDLLNFSRSDLQSITITKQVKSEEFSVSFVTDILSDAIARDLAQSYFEAPMNTLRENTPGG